MGRARVSAESARKDRRELARRHRPEDAAGASRACRARPPSTSSQGKGSGRLAQSATLVRRKGRSPSVARAPKVAASSRATISTKPAAPPSARMAADVVVADLVARAAQARADDADRSRAPRCVPPRSARPRAEHVVLAERMLELGQRAERQAQPVALAVELGLDLAPVPVDHDPSVRPRREG